MRILFTSLDFSEKNNFMHEVAKSLKDKSDSIVFYREVMLCDSNNNFILLNPPTQFDKLYNVDVLNELDKFFKIEKWIHRIYVCFECTKEEFLNSVYVDNVEDSIMFDESTDFDKAIDSIIELKNKTEGVFEVTDYTVYENNCEEYLVSIIRFGMSKYPLIINADLLEDYKEPNNDNNCFYVIPQ